MKLFLVMLAAVSLPAQSLYVYSEFATLDAKGKVVAPQEPREILSPAVARGAFATYQVVVDAPPAMHTWFYMGLNPEDAVKVTVYKPLANGDLQPIELPFEGYGPQVYWIDVWSDRNVPVRRIKVEPQLHVLNLPGDTADWLIYPMEFRVVDAQVPEKKPTETSINCEAPKPAKPGINIASIKYRNALQDAALATSVNRDELAKLTSACKEPESYLRVRDYLLKNVH